ncbi:MAG: TetR/AcrR family transcriptional regulator [Beijerinckiaceae bacterium]
MSNTFTSSFVPPAGGRRGYHHGNLRETLIDAARFLIAEKGPQGFTLLEAARLADVSPAAPYRHFKDRDALIAGVAARGFAMFSERLKTAIAGTTSARDGLEALGRAYLAFAREEPGHYGAMFLAARTPGGANPAPNDDSFGLLLETVRRLLSSPGSPPTDPLPAALQIWTLAHGVASLATTGRWPAIASAPSPEEVLRAGATAVIMRERGAVPA